jgi:probable phosphoglycerate mutase
VTTIILTRHGHVDWIAPERFRGRADLALTDRGIGEARSTGRRIESSGTVAAVYTSPLCRCVTTARIIADRFSLEPETTDGLNDIDYGRWQGLTPDEARASWPDELDLWYRRPDLVEIPGGESLQDVLARAARALRRIVRRHREERVVLVGHDSVNRVVLLHALELPLARYWVLAQAPCAINEIEAAVGGFVVRSVNETSHLGTAPPAAPAGKGGPSPPDGGS